MNQISRKELDAGLRFAILSGLDFSSVKTLSHFVSYLSTPQVSVCECPFTVNSHVNLIGSHLLNVVCELLAFWWNLKRILNPIPGWAFG